MPVHASCVFSSHKVCSHLHRHWVEVRTQIIQGSVQHEKQQYYSLTCKSVYITGRPSLMPNSPQTQLALSSNRRETRICTGEQGQVRQALLILPLSHSKAKSNEDRSPHFWASAVLVLSPSLVKLPTSVCSS